LDAKLHIFGELPLESVVILLSQGAHVVCHVHTKYVFSVNLCVEFLAFGTVAREALKTVGDVEATVNGALHGTKDASTGGCADKTNVQVTTEGTRSFIIGLNVVFISIHIFAALVQLIQTQFLQQLKTKHPIKIYYK